MPIGKMPRTLMGLELALEQLRSLRSLLPTGPDVLDLHLSSLGA